MKRKRLWALAAVLACGALVQLVISATASPSPYSEKDLAGFKARIKQHRQELENWVNDGKGRPQDFVPENAVIIDPSGRATGWGHATVQEKWRRIKQQHGDRRIQFDMEQAKIEIVQAGFMFPALDAASIPCDFVAIEFGTFTFGPGPGAEGGSSSALPPADPTYCALWGHKQGCPLFLIAEIEL